MRIPLLLPVLLALASATHLPATTANRVVLVVWDGMRPDFISPELTPNLSRLAAEGVRFAQHHPVYLSSTEVNGTALATGAWPANSGVIANDDFRPAIDSQNVVSMQVPAVVRKGDSVSGGHYLGRPTIAEILHREGLDTAIAGAKQVALLHDRGMQPQGADRSSLVFQGEALPVALSAELVKTLGEFPLGSMNDTKFTRDTWTTRALIEGLWKSEVPPFSLLWLSEPDSSQHGTGPGSAQSLEAIKSSDHNLGLVLAELDRRGLRETTDVFVVSDHGFSTISRKVDVAVELSVAGFQAKRIVLGGLKESEVLIVSNGGSSLFYVGGHDAAVTERLINYLQQQAWVGVIFSQMPVEGTFPLAEARINSPVAPDVVVSLRWNSDKSATGTPGLQISDLASTNTKLGNHTSLSPYDMHNILVAGGPHLRRALVNTISSANVDVAPTILWLLGLKDAALKMDGRVLSEALTVEVPAMRPMESQRLTAQRQIRGGTWTQYLQISEVNGVRYLDEGNGAFIAEGAASTATR